jgi:glutamyl-tRNA synthetase
VSVRVRFAPSPTGFLHVGGARSALYNWLFARSRGGSLILRSDDTDSSRSADEYREDILESLRWLGIDWDEGIEIGGPHDPYRQSMRSDRYRQVVDLLLESGVAYYAFETEAQLEGFRRESRALGMAPAYDGRFKIDASEASKRIGAGERAPVRFAVPRPGETAFEDVVRGEIEFDHAQVDDFVILRSDGSPTYHLASTVDDVDFGISHVVRGEDILSSTPKHILLTQAMGAQVPRYAHVSLLLGPDGAKLSKRHGDTAVRAFREAGYLPEAMVNYLAILGWSPGGDEEVLPIDQIAERFDLGSVSRNAAVFDVDKLEWMSGVYMRAFDTDEFVARSLPLIESDLGRSLDDTELETLATLAPLAQERAKRLNEIPDQVRFLYTEIAWEDASWQKVMTKEGARDAVAAAVKSLADLDVWGADEIEKACREIVAGLGMSAGKVFQPLRVAVTGSSISPPLFESMQALGRERTVRRLTGALAKLEEPAPSADR